MAVPGRKPKVDAQGRSLSRNRNKPIHEWTEVLDVRFEGAPRLPRTRMQGRPWPKRTRDWWKAVSSMPHCVLWTDSDWQYAIDAALIAAEFHEGDLRAAAPLERREKTMGTTGDYRRDLRIRYVDPRSQIPEVDDSEAAAEVTRLDEYRDLGYGDDG